MNTLTQIGKRHLVIFQIICCLLIAIGTFYTAQYLFRLRMEQMPVIETPHNQITEIPDDVLSQIPSTISPVTLRIPILMYHYVEYVTDKNDTFRESMNIRPDTFDLQMKTLKEAGYTFMWAQELGEVLNHRRNLPKNPILITIDDGHWDVVTDILPILEKYNIKATAYVIPGMTGGSDFMSEAQVQDLIDSGLIEIGSHTVHHIPLQGKLFETAQYEITESRKILRKKYNIPIYSFAYPSGSFDVQAIELVKKAGYTTAMSTIDGTEVNQANRYFLYRLRPGYRVGKDLIDLVSPHSP